MKVKYSEYEHFGVSTDEGVTFKKAKGELIGSGNKLVLRCSIAEEITAVNIYKSEDSVILFNQVTQMHVFFFFYLIVGLKMFLFIFLYWTYCLTHMCICN